MKKKIRKNVEAEYVRVNVFQKGTKWGKASHKGASPEHRLNSVFVALFDVFNVISYNVYTHGYLPVSVFCCNVITGEASAQRNQTSSFSLTSARHGSVRTCSSGSRVMQRTMMAERPGRFHEDEVEERASERDRSVRILGTSVFQLDGILLCDK